MMREDGEVFSGPHESYVLYEGDANFASGLNRALTLKQSLQWFRDLYRMVDEFGLWGSAHEQYRLS